MNYFGTAPEFIEPPPIDELHKFANNCEKRFKEYASFLRRVSALAAPWPGEDRLVAVRYVLPTPSEPFHILEYRCVTCDVPRCVTWSSGAIPKEIAGQVSRIRREVVEHSWVHA
ncbi:hypothetical protein BE11_41905 [Sorangium cellulosum]|nr:hypothetical protein BE11_41905 [Sorangium cellulosum]